MLTDSIDETQIENLTYYYENKKMLICSICNNLLNNPLACFDCKQVFCRKCINSSSEVNNSVSTPVKKSIIPSDIRSTLQLASINSNEEPIITNIGWICNSEIGNGIKEKEETNNGIIQETKEERIEAIRNKEDYIDGNKEDNKEVNKEALNKEGNKEGNLERGIEGIEENKESKINIENRESITGNNNSTQDSNTLLPNVQIQIENEVTVQDDTNGTNLSQVIEQNSSQYCDITEVKKCTHNGTISDISKSHKLILDNLKLKCRYGCKLSLQTYFSHLTHCEYNNLEVVCWNCLKGLVKQSTLKIKEDEFNRLKLKNTEFINKSYIFKDNIKKLEDKLKQEDFIFKGKSEFNLSQKEIKKLEEMLKVQEEQIITLKKELHESNLQRELLFALLGILAFLLIFLFLFGIS